MQTMLSFTLQDLSIFQTKLNHTKVCKFFSFVQNILCFNRFHSRFNLWNVVFVFGRLLTITLSLLTFWYGLSEASFVSRVVALGGICFAQALMMWTFINFHLGRLRERSNEAARKKKTATAASASKKKFDDVDELPEADQPATVRKTNKIKTK